MSLLENLKSRWGVKSNIQVVLIFMAFGLSGSSSVFIMKYIHPWIGIDGDTPLWIKVISFVILTLPVYNIVLIIIGSLLGQYAFFKQFIIKFFRRIFRL